MEVAPASPWEPSRERLRARIGQGLLLPFGWLPSPSPCRTGSPTSQPGPGENWEGDPAPPCSLASPPTQLARCPGAGEREQAGGPRGWSGAGGGHLPAGPRDQTRPGIEGRTRKLQTPGPTGRASLGGERGGDCPERWPQGVAVPERRVGTSLQQQSHGPPLPCRSRHVQQGEAGPVDGLAEQREEPRGRTGGL